jgi:hypothetical protein
MPLRLSVPNYLHSQGCAWVPVGIRFGAAPPYSRRPARPSADSINAA